MSSHKSTIHLVGRTESPSAGGRAAPRVNLDKKKVYRLMAKARALEERAILMNKSGECYFWIGGPGEEAFNVPLGSLIKKGEGLEYDYLHFHYRNSATLLAMGAETIDIIRQAAAVSTDPYSGGRNFVNHFAVKKWNVAPVTSTIETQYSVAPGSALAQRRHGGDGITIVTGGDAGSAEGDFATCLNWSSQPGRELPILIIITNNSYGISTPSHQVHGDKIIARRAEAFGIRWATVNGNDVEASWNQLSEAMNYVRKERKPFCLEATVSRLNGHSSASGGARVTTEVDCLAEFEKELVKAKLFTREECDKIRDDCAKEAQSALKIVRQEPPPDPSTLYDHIFK